jgi:hypothetical protein
MDVFKLMMFLGAFFCRECLAMIDYNNFFNPTNIACEIGAAYIEKSEKNKISCAEILRYEYLDYDYKGIVSYWGRLQDLPKSNFLAVLTQAMNNECSYVDVCINSSKTTEKEMASFLIVNLRSLLKDNKMSIKSSASSVNFFLQQAVQDNISLELLQSLRAKHSKSS